MINTAVILASGLGTRLQERLKGKPKFLLEIYGRPIIAYPISMLSKVGIRNFIVTIPEGWLKAFNEKIQSMYPNLNFTLIENREINRGNGYSFYLTHDYVEDEVFILSMCDHIYTANLVKTLISNINWINDAIVLIAGDSNPKYINVDEATKIQVNKEDYLMKIGKNIGSFKYIDAGVFIIKKRLFEVASKLVDEKELIEFSTILNSAVKLRYNVKVIDINPTPWTEIDTLSDLEEALYGDRNQVIKKVLNYFI